MCHPLELVVLLAAYPTLSSAGLNALNAGPFDVILNQISECDDVGTGQVRFNVRAKKVNRTTLIDFDGYLKVPVDDSITLGVSAAILTNNGYKENYFKEDFSNLCTTGYKMLPKLMKDSAKALGRLPGEKLCPVDPGNITVKNFYMDLDLKGIPVFFYNKYRVQADMKRKHHKIGCMNIWVELLPKKSTKKNRKKPKIT